jgi:uncharacterized membrane protein
LTDAIRRTLLVLGILFGACYAIILPPMQAPDEFAHFFRAYNVSDGYCIAPPLSMIPQSVEDVAVAYPPKFEKERRIGYRDIWQSLHAPFSATPQRGLLNESINLYNCIPYAPAAAAIRAGRICNASPALLLYLARFANLTVYLVVVYLALRQLPDFELPLLAIALMPMALHQAASASWDAVAFSSAFFLCAYLVKLIWDPRTGVLQLSHYLILAAAIIAASLCKINVWLALLIVLAPVSRFRSIRHRRAVLLGCLLLAVVITAGWNAINRENINSWIEYLRVQHQTTFSANLAAVYQHPWLFLLACARTWTERWRDLAAEFVGTFGWLSIPLPAWSVWLYVLLLVYTALAGTKEVVVKLSERLVFAGVGVLGLAFTFITIWCANTPDSYRDSALYGSGFVLGVQGRYFIPFSYPLLVALSNLRLRVNRKWLWRLTAVTIVVVNAVALEQILRGFYLAELPR